MAEAAGIRWSTAALPKLELKAWAADRGDSGGGGGGDGDGSGSGGGSGGVDARAEARTLLALLLKRSAR